MDLESVVDELYGLDPADFTPTRDARARQARQAGDRELAGAIKALRKPSTSAWAVNLLARHQEKDLGHLLGLGEQLRAAQASLSGDEIRALGHQRHQVVAGMARQARKLAWDRGVKVSDAVEREISDTLEAALADPAAGAVAGSGRLLRSLIHTGLAEVDLDGAVAGIPPEAAGAGRRNDVEAEASAAEAEAARAAQAVEAARARLDRAEASHGEAAERAEEAAGTVQLLQRQLDQARRAADEAGAVADAAAREVEQARSELTSAEEAAGQAGERARDLRRRASSGRSG